MIINDKDDYITYRFKRAEESFDDAVLLVKHEKWNAAINRLYYALFYAIIALLLKNNIEVQTHDGVRNQFGLMFIKTGILDRKYGLLFSKLFDYRQKGDYGDLYDFGEEQVVPLLEQVNCLIIKIKSLLQ